MRDKGAHIHAKWHDKNFRKRERRKCLNHPTSIFSAYQRFCPVLAHRMFSESLRKKGLLVAQGPTVENSALMPQTRAMGRPMEPAASRRRWKMKMSNPNRRTWSKKMP